MNKKFILGYVSGVVTAPIWLYVFRQPIAEHILFPLLADEDLNEQIYTFMSLRNDYIDKKKQEQDHGKP